MWLILLDQLGVTPEEVITKIMSNPDLARGFQNPRVQQAMMECSQNPWNIAKYQNDKEVMDVINKLSELFPAQGGPSPFWWITAVLSSWLPCNRLNSIILISAKWMDTAVVAKVMVNPPFRRYMNLDIFKDLLVFLMKIALDFSILWISLIHWLIFLYLNTSMYISLMHMLIRRAGDLSLLCN